MNQETIPEASPETPNEDDFKKWNQSNYVEAMKYCDKHGFKVEKFDQKQSRVLPPMLAVWKIELATRPKSSIWVIGGEVMMDHVDAGVAPNAREVLRHFSMSWQLKAEQLQKALDTNSSGNLDVEQQKQVIDTLISKAEALYDMYSNEKAWHMDTE